MSLSQHLAEPPAGCRGSSSGGGSGAGTSLEPTPLRSLIIHLPSQHVEPARPITGRRQRCCPGAGAGVQAATPGPTQPRGDGRHLPAPSWHRHGKDGAGTCSWGSDHGHCPARTRGRRHGRAQGHAWGYRHSSQPRGVPWGRAAPSPPRRALGQGLQLQPRGQAEPLVWGPRC